MQYENRNAKDGRFGDFGGKYIPETLVPAIEELEENYQKIKSDKSFQNELDYYLKIMLEDQLRFILQKI